MKNNKTVIIASIVIVITLVILTIAGSYAFYVAKFTPKGSGTISGSTAKLELTFTDDSTINVTNLIPGESATKTFSITSNGNKTIKYKISINNVQNNFEKQEDVKLELKEGDSSLNTITFPNKTTSISEVLSIEPGETKNYTIIIRYESTEDSNQINDMGHSVSGRIFIEGA